ncbi:hypothetical protein ACQY0O_005124 [Thecaphora frezii]
MLYTSLVASSLLLAILFLVYRQRGLLYDLLPAHLQDRVPPFLLPSPNDTRTGMLGSLFSSSSSSSAARYARIGAFDWGTSIRSGLNSSLFDIEANVRNGDQRSGLDERGAMDVHTIMQQYGVLSLFLPLSLPFSLSLTHTHTLLGPSPTLQSFDEARLIRHKQILASNNIDPLTGLPLDSKAVTSLGGTIGGAAGSSRASR